MVWVDTMMSRLCEGEQEKRASVRKARYREKEKSRRMYRKGHEVNYTYCRSMSHPQMSKKY